MSERLNHAEPSDHEASLPMDLVGPWLVDRTGDEQWGSGHAELISGGKSNLTFCVTSEVGSVVLRRPPEGNHPAGAHDVEREARVQQQLAHSSVPVPLVVGVDDGRLLGTPFYVMQAVEGHCVRGELPVDYASSLEQRRSLSFAFIDSFANLHEVDPVAVGLSDLGRPDGFVERQVERWTRQWQTARCAEVSAVDQLGERLIGSIPAQSAATIVHGDCKLDNVLLHLADPSRVEAILDWEMSTLGDPMTDLAWLLMFWREPGEPQLTIAPTVTQLDGFPSRQDMIERYATTRDVNEDHLAFLEGLAHLKFAVILQGIANRSRTGAMAGQDYDNADAEVELVASEGLDRMNAAR